MTDAQPAAAPSNYERRRMRIAEAAWNLFLDRGYDNVSTAEVATAAAVAEKTVFNHFRKKEDIVFRRYDAVLHEFEASLRTRDRSKPITQALLDSVRDEVDLKNDFPEENVKLAAIINSSPTLQRKRLDLLEEHAAVLVTILLEEDPSLEEGGLAQGLGLALTSIHWAVLTAHGVAIHRGMPVEDARQIALRAAERGYGLLEGGMNTLNTTTNKEK